MTRRDFPLSLAAAALTPPVAAVPTEFAFRYMTATCLYGGMTLEEIVPELEKTGALAIDVWSSHAEPVPQRDMMERMGRTGFRQLLERYRTRLGCLTHFKLGPFGLRDEIPVAAELGGKGTLLVAGSRWPGGRPVPVTDTAGHRDAVKRFVAELGPYLELAEKHGVILALENHSGQMLSTPDSVRWLVELEPSRALAVALSPYHLEQNPAMLARLIEDLGPRLALFYAWQHGKGSAGKMPKAHELEQLPGRGTLDFRPLVAALQKIQYQGWTEIFMHPFPRGVPILPTVAEVTAEINRARTYLEGCAL